MTLEVGNVRVKNRSELVTGGVTGEGGVIPQFQRVTDREVLFTGAEVLESDGSGLRVIDPIAHVMTATPANVEVTDIFTLLVGGVAVAVFVATGATVKNVVEGLQAAWEANKANVPGAEDITATENDLVVTLTHDIAGVPFIVTATAVEDTGGNDTQTLTMADLAQNDTGPEIVLDLNHVLGETSIEFDKVDGTHGKVRCGIEKLLTVPLDLSRFTAPDLLEAVFSIPNIADVDTVEVRIGTDSANYNEWWIEDGSLTGAIWELMSVALNTCEMTVVGNGWDPSRVVYVAFVVEFDAQDDALADILLDYILVRNA